MKCKKCTEYKKEITRLKKDVSNLQDEAYKVKRENDWKNNRGYTH